jgi:hypothetical protein
MVIRRFPDPKVFIIILNWNGLKDTLECLESVYKLDYQNFEVIVVDNGSTDNSVAVIRENYPEVIMIENKENLGYTGGNNIGMRYASNNGADYVWLLNNDTVVMPDTLSKLIDTAESDPEIGLISPIIYYYDEPEKIQYCGSYMDWENYTDITLQHLEALMNITSSHTFYLWGTALLIKRSVIEKIGYLDQKYFAYHEDWEYCLRALKSGYKSVLEPRGKIYHKGSKSTGGRKIPIQVFLRLRNLYFLWMANLRGYEKIRYLRRYTKFVISYSTLLRGEGLEESANACLDGGWNAIHGIGGPCNKSTKMPYLFKKILSWHPYFWAGLLTGEFLKIAFEIVRRANIKLFRTSS